VAALVLATGPAPARVVGSRQNCGRLVHGGKATGSIPIRMYTSASLADPLAEARPSHKRK
jgi:hypothetical protein